MAALTPSQLILLGGASSEACPVSKLLRPAPVVDNRKGLAALIRLRVGEIECDEMLSGALVLSEARPGVACHDSLTHAAQRCGSPADRVLQYPV
jgi:hypothetical protein